MQLYHPTRKPEITQHFGNKSKLYKTSHDGVDYRVRNDPKEEVLAAADGKVFKIITGVKDWFYPSGKTWKKTVNYGKVNPYGNEIIIEHVQGGKTFYTRYGHLDKVSVEVGQAVTAGQLIGEGGNTGYSQGVHLHFMAQWVYGKGGTTFNPEPFLKSLNKKKEIEQAEATLKQAMQELTESLKRANLKRKTLADFKGVKAFEYKVVDTKS